ncbi:MAG: hypothetical protein JKY96_09130 [Phycisphaerales bacterium]|nr:hypothetical protein [Phycisphaerales bacterium]
MQVGPEDPTNETQSTPVPAPQDESAQAITTEPGGSILEQAKDNPMIPSLLLVGGVLLAIMVMFRAVRKGYRTRKVRDRNTPSPAARIDEIHQRAQSSMDPTSRSMVDAEQLARRLGAQLDNKAARIELLLEEADRKLDLLNRQIAGIDRTGSLPMTSPTGQAEQPHQRAIDPSLLDRARIDQDLAERSPVATASTPGSAQDQINERILHLADDGLGSVEIARSLNQPIGQVELILNLRKTS